MATTAELNVSSTVQKKRRTVEERDERRLSLWSSTGKNNVNDILQPVMHCYFLILWPECFGDFM